MYVKQFRVFDKRGNPLPVMDGWVDRSDAMMADITTVVIDIDMDLFAEYCREVQTAPTLNSIMYNWNRL